MSAKRLQAGLAVLLSLALAGAARSAGGPIDAPESAEPRVPIAKSLAAVGLYGSKGNFQAFTRVSKGDVLYTRDVLVALPGFKVELQPDNKVVNLLLWGNLPSLSNSPVLDSAVILHDSRAYDLDFTLLRGRVVLTNTRAKGEAKIWLRTEDNGVQLVLPEPGDKVAIEIYGRWPTGVPFGTKGRKPIRMWQVFVLKGNLDIRTGRNTYAMSAPPGRAYFAGNNVTGPDGEGPQPVREVPEWADPSAKAPPEADVIAAVAKFYRGKVTANNADEVGKALLAMARKETDKKRAAMVRRLVVYAMCALDDIENVATILNTSPHAEMRQAAVVALRHWIGSRTGRDEKLYKVLRGLKGFSKVEAEAVMQMLHSPFAPDQAETFETLITYLKHRKMAVRELAYWHLIRLSPINVGIPFDAAAGFKSRSVVVGAWEKLIPSGTLPRRKKDDTKDK